MVASIDTKVWMDEDEKCGNGERDGSARGVRTDPRGEVI
jgi:hypothetical protein